MICGCCKDLGCFTYNQTIDFGVNAILATNDYIFHIWSNGSYWTETMAFSPGDPLELAFTFNENSETTIKIELPSDIQDVTNGIAFVTTKDGACCFTIHGLIGVCQ